MFHQHGRSMYPRWSPDGEPFCLRTFLSLPLGRQVSFGCFAENRWVLTFFPPLFTFVNLQSGIPKHPLNLSHFLICSYNNSPLLTVPPPEERNRLWMVEADISPEMIKRKKKKKKRRKEVRNPDVVVENQTRLQREFGRSSVPRLPKLPCHPSLVANLREQQRQQTLEQGILPGSLPDYEPCEERCSYLECRSSRNGYLMARVDCPENLGLRPSCHPLTSNWQPSGSSMYPGEVERTDGLSERMAHVARVPAGRRAGYGPIHSRTNLMEAELMDADSDF